MKHLIRTLLAALLALATQSAWADSVPFEQANRLYEEGRYLEAIDGYRALLTNRSSAAVHFNLGNAYFKSGQIGQAIVQYHQAEDLSPRDPDVLANLDFARARVEGPRYQAGWLQRKALTLTPREWATLATLAVWLFFALLTLRQLQPKWRLALRSWALVAGVLAAMLLTCAIWISKSSASTQLAVVTQREAVMRLGPFEESQSALTLRNGVELRVLSGKEGWLQVTTDDKQIGWIQSGMVAETRP